MIPHSSNKSRQARLEMQDEKPDPNPDGEYWKLGAKSAQAQLTYLIGNDEYEAWAELVWPGETIDALTWRDIYQQSNSALDYAYQGKREITLLADAARYPEKPAPGCYGLPD